MKIPNKQDSPAFTFLMECVGYSFYVKKTRRDLDQWEVFAMGYRNISEIINDQRIGYTSTKIKRS